MPRELLSKSTGDSEATEVNVIFHGTFGFLLEPNYVLVSTPKVPEHTYGARISGKSILNYATPLTLIPFQPTTVVLCPNDKHCDPQNPPKATKSLYVSKQLKPGDFHSEDAYYNLKLPLPTHFIPLRCMHFGSDSVWEGKDKKNTQGWRSPATAMLLQYKSFVLSDFSMILRDPQEHRGVDLIPPIDQSGNIHFYADPVIEMSMTKGKESHQTAAFRSLAKLYSIDLDFKPPTAVGGTSDPKADPPTSIPPNVTREDELLLSELIGPQMFEPVLGLYGRNCTNVIVRPLPMTG